MSDKLLKGFKDFKSEAYEGGCTLMKELVEKGQDPEYFMISCIDSRANPGTIFAPKPGAFFAHKTMGAIIPPYEGGTELSAALQFALTYQNVTKIVVMGHTGCGAVKALVDGLDDDEIQSFVGVVKDSIRPTHRETEEQVVLDSVKNLMTYPSVVKAMEEDRLMIKPWLFDMKAGDILEFNAQSEQFEVVSE